MSYPQNDGSNTILPELVIIQERVSQGSKRIREPDPSLEPLSNSKRSSQARGKNWNEEDSLLLIEAVSWAEGSKKRIAIYVRVLITASEHKAITDKRMNDYFNELQPAERRTTKACLNRFGEMETSYKFNHPIMNTNRCRYILGYQNGRVAGSTGGESWWTLGTRDRAARLTKKRVLMMLLDRTNDRFNCLASYLMPWMSILDIVLKFHLLYS